MKLTYTIEAEMPGTQSIDAVKSLTTLVAAFATALSPGTILTAASIKVSA